MHRDLDRIASDAFDVVVVGGGVHGATAAMEAAQRGLSVALVEKGDFGSSTSHNSLKIVHGGIRYLQHVDIGRVRQSITERRFWLRCAPHMVRPLDFWIPVQGWGTRGAPALWAAMRVHETLGLDRNSGVAADGRIPAGKIAGSDLVARSIGDLWGPSPPAAAVWWDGQMVDSDRLILECLQAAWTNGAAIANYVEATGLEKTRDGNVAALQVRDRLGDREFSIRCENVVLAAGPWASTLSQQILGGDGSECGGLVRNLNIVIDRQWTSSAFGIYSTRRSDAVVGKSNRLFFMVPWRECSILGTTHEPYEGDADSYVVERSEAEAFLEEVDGACPSLELDAGDIVYVYAGLTPSGQEKGSADRSRKSEIVDYEQAAQVSGLYSIVGVKYTTARALAEQVVDLIGRRRGELSGSVSARTPLPGAAGLTSLAELQKEIRRVGVKEAECALDLAIAYGTQYRAVLETSSGAELDRAAVLDARVRYAARNEMARSLADVVFRRLDWMQRGRLDKERIDGICRTLGAELGWTGSQQAAELQQVDRLARLPVNASR